MGLGTSAAFSGPSYYDECLGPLWFEAFAADLAGRLPECPPRGVLEIACGTGRLTRRLRERLHPSVRLVATDLSLPMLDYARDHVGAPTGIEWGEANAMKLPFDDREFGAVVCGFGLMFVPNVRGALAEARRVMVERGVLLLNVWDRIEDNPHALAVARVLEALFPGDPEMSFRFAYEMGDAELLRSLLEGAGFGDVHVEKKRISVRAAEPRQIATGQIRGTPRSALIEQRGISLDAVIDKVVDGLVEIGGCPYEGGAQAVIVSATAL